MGHVHKSAHAKYELCSCPGRRDFTPSGGCQELPVAPSWGKNPRTIGSCESKVACNFFKVFRVFECLKHFLDLINSKYCTHEYNILNFSDLEKVDKTFFKITKYLSEKNTFFLAK